MHSPARAAEAPQEFARHCEVRLIEQQHLWTTMRVALRADIICLDFDHPDIDGLQFATATKTRFPSIPILMLIAEQSADIVLWALRSRIFDVLVKPVTAQEILRVTQRLAPILSARRKQAGRANMATSASIPGEARYRLREHARHKLAAAVEYIAKNYARQIGEREIAQMCGMTPFRFSRGFRAVYGVTFRDYLADHRLKQSRRLLANRGVAITDVAAMSGFNDPSYFARLFRRRLGMSPSDYRASLAKEGVEGEPAGLEKALTISS
jgi:AraC-like DNA-binding protein/CheY-like chemotaxis protein